MMGFSRFLGIVAVCAAVLGVCQNASAQDWGWQNDRGGGGGYDDRDYNRRPASPPPPPPQPYGGGPYGQPNSYSQPQGAGGYGQPQRPQAYGASANPRCRELEMQLAGGSQTSVADQLPRIEAELRQADYDYRRLQSDADRANCYEDMFLFGRSLKQNQRCIDIDRQVQLAKSKLGQLKAQRDVLMRGNSPRGRRDEIVAELARNRCGDSYAREYDQQRNRSSSLFSFFSDEDTSDDRRGTAYNQTYTASTFKTMCVRLCDGFYFPISYATSEGKFQEDAGRCQSQCAAPAELYYARSDQEAEQLVSLSGKPYTALPTAFRNRKSFIRGCSCNANEYNQAEIVKSEEALRLPAAKRADATPVSRPRPSEGPATRGLGGAPGEGGNGPQEDQPQTTR